ncbi:bifunctional copper resistance protein CopD/cytochrome c oxidase assembly protein [Corynebacterium incognita]|uniref:Bifunctional copper resistance protein CopD/cytochrome c oxidase assembly protein n=1 Tax=Corynebacterium incognita TaxID=2754725 RepID=A0A7G7CR51_9CORY|nr:cytochrome c oxidase assembly protein [Corynebacterium incognita]QNE90067.1 bifunctional copper resistance protein CopD/cytochrome c oxidase assembly protein [Corynebacterium incognita]
MVETVSVTAHGGQRSKVRATWPYVLLTVVLAGVVGGGISMFFLADSLAALGIPDPGVPTTFGLPFFRAVAWILMAVTVGSFMASAFLITPRRVDVGAVDAGGEDTGRRQARPWLLDAALTVDGHLAARMGRVSAWLLVLVSLIEVPMVLSDVSGTPFLKTLDPQSFGEALRQVSTSMAWFVTALVALLVAVLATFARSWALQPVIFLVALLTVVPLGMDGHSASGGDHDYGTNSYLWHLVFMVLWVGGLVALLAHGRRLGPGMGTAVARYSKVALFAIVVMSVSGVINALIRVEVGDLLTTRYGLIIVAKAALTVVLGLLGFAHRELTIPQLHRRPELFRRVAFVEILVMAATVGVAITMGRTPPPPPRDPNLTAMQIQFGYNLEQAPGWGAIFTNWRFDVMFGTIGLLLAAGYVALVLRLRRQGKQWPWRRTMWWLLGSLGLTFVMSSGLGIYFPALYSMHMLGHMILSMVIPVLLVLGAPLTLIVEATEPNEAEPGLHEWVEAFLASDLLRFLTHPAYNLIQFLVIFYAIYMNFDFYNLAISEHAGHLLMNTSFLVSGYMYFWELIGKDPIPNRRPTHLRLFVLFLSMPVHLYFGVYLMQLNTVMGEPFYQSIDLPWNPDLLHDQKVGGGIAWAFGQFPLVIVFGALFIEWLSKDREEAAVFDAKAKEDHDMDLDDYNAMLANLSGGDAEAERKRRSYFYGEDDE